MESLADNHYLQEWLIHYGSLTIFILLTLGILIIPVPVPEETLLVISGALMSLGKLNITPTIAAALLGSFFGITVSYVLGRSAGRYLIRRYGSWIGISQDHLDSAHSWFERYGKWTLFFGYFVPGLRHFTGFTAGMSTLEYRDFALFAYSGAALWVTFFLSLGYFFGDFWFSIINTIELNLEDFVLVLCLLAFVYLIYYVNFKK